MSKAPKLRFKEFSGDWEKKKIGEITTKVGSGKTPKGGNSVYTDSGVIFLRSQNVLNGKLNLSDVAYITEEINSTMKSTEVYGDDILLNITGASIGRSCNVPKNFPKANVNQHVCIIRLNEHYNSNFIMNQIISEKVQRQIDSYQAGGNREGLNFEQIKSIKVDSTCIEEQEKIASFFSLIDDKISLQGEKLEMLKDYKRGMMQKIFSRELRFKDDDGRDYPEWEHKKLNRIVERITRKNKGTICTLPLTISAQYGLVDQVTFFNKTVASANLEGYYLLEKGEFAYNKSYSTGYPFGAIKRLDRYDRGVLSSLYICFSILEGVDSDFLVQYFETSCWHKEISMIAVEGARNHGLLNISVSDFFETYHWIPCYDEQVKIGEFLGKIDEKINKEQDMLDSLNEYKKGLLQKMFV